MQTITDAHGQSLTEMTATDRLALPGLGQRTRPLSQVARRAAPHGRQRDAPYPMRSPPTDVAVEDTDDLPDAGTRWTDPLEVIPTQPRRPPTVDDGEVPPAGEDAEDEPSSDHEPVDPTDLWRQHLDRLTAQRRERRTLTAGAEVHADRCVICQIILVGSAAAALFSKFLDLIRDAQVQAPPEDAAEMARRYYVNHVLPRLRNVAPELADRLPAFDLEEVTWHLSTSQYNMDSDLAVINQLRKLEREQTLTDERANRARNNAEYVALRTLSLRYSMVLIDQHTKRRYKPHLPIADLAPRFDRTRPLSRELGAVLASAPRLPGIPGGAAGAGAPAAVAPGRLLRQHLAGGGGGLR